MDIGYVGILAEEGTCLMRMRALQTLGHKVIPIDTQSRGSQPRVARELNRLCHKLGFPLDVSGVNAQLLQLIAHAPPDIVWIDEGLVVWPRTLKRLKARAPHTLLVHYNPDDPFGYYGKAGWRNFIRALPFYDVHFVPRWQNISEYAAQGAQRIIRAYRGFCPMLHRPLALSASEREEFGDEVGFIGSYEEPRATALESLATAGFSSRIWGSGWERASKTLRVEKTPLYRDVYVKAINSFNINLQFLRDYSENTGFPSPGMYRDSRGLTCEQGGPPDVRSRRVSPRPE